ncbi:MAG: LamG domain-containing protein, partial [Candidatus Syntropharchaeia archaeon]
VLREEYLRFKTGCRGIESNGEVYGKGELVDYNGRVYGITVPQYHIIYVRRNGKSCWVGNCDCGNDESLNITDAITVEMWANLATLNQPGEYGADLLQMNNPGTCYGYTLWYRNSDQRIAWLKQCDASSNTYSNPLTEAGKWIHIVGTYNGSTFKIYVNGILEDTNSYSTTFSNVGPLNIGRGDDGYFNGTTGEVRIYNRALSAGEISSRFESTRSIYGV